MAQVDPLRVEVVLPIGMHDVLSGDVVAEIVPETDPDNARAAKTIIIDPMTDSASGTFRVALEPPNLGHKLLGGIRCNTRFALRETEPSEPTDPAPAPLSLPPIVNSPLTPFPVDTLMTAEQTTRVLTTQMCRRVGPIESLSQVQRVVGALAAEAVRSQVSEATELVPHGYIVLMRGRSTEDLDHLQERLRAHKVTDFF